MKFFPRTTSIFDVFNDVFDDEWFHGSKDYTMRTNIVEEGENYLLDMELPGYSKEAIQLELNNGYLTISASNHFDQEEKNQAGNLIRQERYYGNCKRSFYVGDNIKEEDIKAKYENGELKIMIPKQVHQVSEKKTIMIE